MQNQVCNVSTPQPFSNILLIFSNINSTTFKTNKLKNDSGSVRHWVSNSRPFRLLPWPLDFYKINQVCILARYVSSVKNKITTFLKCYFWQILTQNIFLHFNQSTPISMLLCHITWHPKVRLVRVIEVGDEQLERPRCKSTLELTHTWLKTKVFIFIDWVAYWQGRSCCSSPPTKVLFGPFEHLSLSSH